MGLRRIVIYPSDVERITGKSDRYSRSLIADIKEHYKKKDYQMVTIKEFSEYTGIDTELIRFYID